MLTDETLLAEIEMSARLRNCLTREVLNVGLAPCETVGDVRRLTDQQLLCIGNLGRKSLKEAGELGLRPPGDPSVVAILKERKSQHGAFHVHACFSQRLKDALGGQAHGVCSNYPHSLAPAQREALEMIQHNIGRILAGDPNCVNHWDGIAEYATLVSNILRVKTNGHQETSAALLVRNSEVSATQVAGDS